MAVRCETVVQAVRAYCPPRFALEGDRTGLQVGRTDADVERVLFTLDLTLAVAEEARDRGCGLVVSHHAVIFRPLQHLRTDDFKGRILETLIKADVAVYVPHTALDVVEGGMNDHLAASVGLTQTRFLKETGRDACELLVTPLPEALAGLSDELLERGALTAREVGARLEVVVPTRRSASVSRRLEQAVGEAPRVIPLGSDVTPRGIGRIGRLPAPEPLNTLARRLKEALGAPGVRVVSPTDGRHSVEKVAVLGGDGRSFVHDAIFAGADALVTGDVDHHTALEARAKGLALIDVGHWASERQVAELLIAGVRARLEDIPVELLASEVDTQPFAFV